MDPHRAVKELTGNVNCETGEREWLKRLAGESIRLQWGTSCPRREQRAVLNFIEPNDSGN